MVNHLVRQGSGECSRCNQITGLYKAENVTACYCLECINDEEAGIDPVVVCHEGCVCDWDEEEG